MSEDLSESLIAAPAQDAAVFCPRCSYDVRGLTRPTCPECGGALDSAALAQSQIPWVQRKQAGLVRGFVKTCLLVTFRRNFLVRELARSADYREAKKFRFIVAALVWFTLMVGAGLTTLSTELGEELADIAETNPVMVTLGVVGLALLLFATVQCFTAMHTLAYDPRAMPRDYRARSLALSYYLCGPLAIWPIAGALIPGGIWSAIIGNNYDIGLFIGLGYALVLLGALVFGTSLLLFWINAFRLSGKLAHRGLGGQTTIALALPMLWLLAAAVLLVLVPALVVYIVILLRLV